MRKPSKAVAILKWKLRRGREVTPENLLAVLEDTRNLVIPPEFRRPPVVPIGDDPEDKALRKAIEDFQAEVQAVRDANEQLLSDMVIDGYYRTAEAAANDPQNVELANLAKKLRDLLEREFNGDIPDRPL